MEKRTFRTFDFFSKLSSDLRPVSLAFYQVAWDQSVKNTFHNILGKNVLFLVKIIWIDSLGCVLFVFEGMKEPRYDFDFEPRYLPPQEFSVERSAFNTYLEKYRDRKDVNEEVVKHYLGMTCPFNGYPNVPKYPLAVPNEKWVPDWYKFELIKYHKRQGKWKMMPF